MRDQRRLIWAVLVLVLVNPWAFEVLAEPNRLPIVITGHMLNRQQAQRSGGGPACRGLTDFLCACGQRVSAR